MWARFMGVQHGTMEGGDGKVRVNEENYSRLRPLAEQLHYGDMRFLESNPADATVEYGNKYYSRRISGRDAKTSTSCTR